MPPCPAPPQAAARRILGSAWWAGFTFNGITRCERGTDALVGGDGQRLGQRPGSPMHQMPLRMVPGES
ncbi:hypothetical protein NZK33_20200 [Cyanobium sp. FGCU-6]|jgi:hypothetical protein|nr:hypothetical protein [Cyanobium sp. FGCU6]